MNRRQQRKRTQKLVQYRVRINKQMAALIASCREGIRRSGWATRILEHRKSKGLT